jgi:hypothetical protein
VELVVYSADTAAPKQLTKTKSPIILSHHITP